MSPISHKSVKSIEDFVDRVAFKLGFVSKDNLTYFEQIKLELQNSKREVTENVKQFKEDLDNVMQKLKISSHEKDDFKEEMKSFLMDSVNDLVSQGYSEEEALKRAFEQFGDEHTLETEVVRKQNKEGWMNMNMKEQEAVGLFYAAGLFLGVGGGATAGFFYNHLFIGASIGAVIGIGLGLLSNAFIALKHN
jgi:hypothetical protein